MTWPASLICWSRNRILVVPPLKAVTLKCSGAGVGDVGLTRALALPPPAFVPFGHLLPAAFDTEHVLRPLPLARTKRGRNTSIRLAVVPGVSFLTLRVSLIDFGFFFVPAFVGLTLTVPDAGP